jgi:hypothetical protein
MVAPALRKIRGWTLVDAVVGVLAPMVLLLSPMSPFRDSSWGPARLQHLSYLAYFGTAIALVSFVLGLTPLAKKYGDAFAGGLAMSAVVAAVTGFALLPTGITDTLTVLLIGGFLPFLVAVSLSRLANRTFIASDARRPWLFAAVALLTASVSALSAYAIWATDGERLVRQKIEGLHIGQSLSLRETVPGAWKIVAEFGPYTSGDEVERTLGFKWHSARKHVLQFTEGHMLLVFASKTDVIHSVVLRENTELGYCIDGQVIRRRGPEACSNR